ncbi:MAG: hypothetical protein NW208_08395 [Bryobacter sp.]|nr:hypothetical protein [Bryobacter sp.]
MGLLVRLFLASSLVLALALAQEPFADGYKAYTDAPRLLLRPNRLRLLKREREREAMRYRQFDAYIANRQDLEENAFAYALAGKVYENPAYCRAAADWALKPKFGDLRQLALLYDWCAELLPESQLTALAARLRAELPPPDSIPHLRDRAFAALALVDADGNWSETTLRSTVAYWRETVAPAIRAQKPVNKRDLYALVEFLHAIRDNFDVDLRRDAAQFFLDLPLLQMLSYYPAGFPGRDNEFRISFYTTNTDPDLTLATLERAADLALVAYDTNAELAQPLQGWLMQDRYLMRGPSGIAYEFLWANPYQPGLTYHHLPNSYHDRANGRLFLRAGWEEEARYMCFSDGKLQVFEDGARKLIALQPGREPIEIGEATLLVGEPGATAEVKFQLHGLDREAWYVVGLEANKRYDIEVDDEELYDQATDSGGILSLDFQKPIEGAAVRVRLSRFRAGEPTQ